MLTTEELFANPSAGIGWLFAGAASDAENGWFLKTSEQTVEIIRQQGG